jgi:hypothetical protein
MVRASSLLTLPIASFRSMISGLITSLRENANSWRVSDARARRRVTNSLDVFSARVSLVQILGDERGVVSE